MPEVTESDNKFKILFVVLLSAAAYVALGYFIPRSDTPELLALYILLFAGYLYLHKYLIKSVRAGIIIAVFFRLLLLFSIPALSDDFFRFVWDARLFTAGLNPFDYPPEYFMTGDFSIPGIGEPLYSQLNFKIYRTMYPPVPQFIGWVAVKIAGSSLPVTVVVIRIFVLAAEFMNLLLIRRLLKIYNIPGSNLLLYALNPLVILELTGNLHHEVFVITFLLLSFYYLKRNNLLASASAFALAVVSKLIPLIFLPALISRLGLKRFLIYGVVVVLVSGLMFLPFINEQLISAFSSSGSLYFKKFEFNASIYYIVREVGFWVKGYNIIQTAGPWLGVSTFIGILAVVFLGWKKRMNEPEVFMWILMVYVSFTTILHPWYIVPLMAFSIFTKYRFPILWSLFIFFTYSGYSDAGFRENLWLISVEYLVVFGAMTYEILTNNNLLKRIKLFGMKL